MLAMEALRVLKHSKQLPGARRVMPTCLKPANDGALFSNMPLAERHAFFRLGETLTERVLIHGAKHTTGHAGERSRRVKPRKFRTEPLPALYRSVRRRVRPGACAAMGAGPIGGGG